MSILVYNKKISKTPQLIRFEGLDLKGAIRTRNVVNFHVVCKGYSVVFGAEKIGGLN